jgi:hypothetical protein
MYYKNQWRISETNLYLLLVRSAKHSRSKCIETYEYHVMRGIQLGEISKLVWLMGLVKHAIGANYLYFLYLPLLSVSKILASSQLML